MRRDKVATDDELVFDLLRQHKEQDWFDFKRELRIFSTEGKGTPRLNAELRDEFLKDLLGLANGNPHIIRKTKYLIIGADDKQFEDDGMRKIHPVKYRVPTESEIAAWLHTACTPAVTGITCRWVSVKGQDVYVISIPPTFDLHETTRPFKIGRSGFSPHTVFMRKGEHTVPASIQDGITIRELKLKYQRESTDPPAPVLGMIVGAVVATSFWNAGYRASKTSGLGMLVSLGIVGVFGGVIGFQIGGLWRDIIDLGMVHLLRKIGSRFWSGRRIPPQSSPRAKDN